GPMAMTLVPSIPSGYAQSMRRIALLSGLSSPPSMGRTPRPPISSPSGTPLPSTTTAFADSLPPIRAHLLSICQSSTARITTSHLPSPLQPHTLPRPNRPSLPHTHLSPSPHPPSTARQVSTTAPLTPLATATSSARPYPSIAPHTPF